MRTLLSDLRVNLTEEGVGIVSTGGRYFSVSQQTVALLNVLKNVVQGETSSELAEKLSFDLGFTVSALEFEEAVTKLPVTFFEHTKAIREFRWSVSLVQGRSLEMLTKLFSYFFSPLLALLLIITSCYALWKIFEEYTVRPVNSFLVPLLVLISILFHEIGHAAACHRGGAKPDSIGIGLNRIFPVFYTNVSDIWSRGRWARVRVDVGGIYFQILYAAALTILVPSYPDALAAVSLILILAIFSSLPYFKFDGYWFLGDLLRIDDLGSSLKNKRADLAKKYRTRALSRNDLAPLVGITCYYAGMLTLVGLTAMALVNLTATNALTVFEGVRSKDIPFTAMLMLVLLLMIIGAVLRTLVLSVREFYFLVFDLPPILCALTLGLLVTLAKPMLHLPSKHRAYVYGVIYGMRQAVPPVLNAKSKALGSVVMKYYELLWYRLLDSVSVKIGIWIVRKTHSVQSRNTFADIARNSGPVILAAPHFGSFISGALLVLSEIGKARPIHLFYADPAKDPGNAGYEDFYRRYFPNLSVCLSNKRGIVKAANALKRGEVLIIMPDAFSGADLLAIEFMGRNIGVMGGIAYFHRKFDATIIPVLSFHAGLTKVEVHIGEAFNFEIPSDNEANVNKFIMQQVFCWFEPWFRRYPDNWHCWEKFGRNLIN